MANVTTVGFAYLITVLLIAASWGLPESALASITATVCFNFFFLPPVGKWTIADPQNWVALFAFLATSLIASQLSDRAKRRSIETERLYRLSRAIMAVDGGEGIGEHIAQQLATIYEIPVVVVHDRISNTVHFGGIKDALPADVTVVTSVELSLAGQDVGRIDIRGGHLSSTALQAVSNLIAISLENARSRDVATRAQAARHSEEFKSTLLDSLAHEFKTPLTSIRAATTALLASNISDPAYRQVLLTIVDQEAERLSELVSEATRLARIEAGNVQLNRRAVDVRQMIETALEQMKSRCDGRAIAVEFTDNISPVLIDIQLVQLALTQLVDNALKYSPSRSPIRISARMTGDNVFINIHNSGDALSEIEQARIFDKFYRGAHVRQKVAGTGMGLAIAREILVAHGGNIHLESSTERGTEFTMMLPVPGEVSA